MVRSQFEVCVWSVEVGVPSDRLLGHGIYELRLEFA